MSFQGDTPVRCNYRSPEIPHENSPESSVIFMCVSVKVHLCDVYCMAYKTLSSFVEDVKMCVKVHGDICCLAIIRNKTQ